MNAPRLVMSAAIVAAGCSGEPGTLLQGAGGAPVVDQALPPGGVPDRGDDPAVVALDLGGYVSCSGALIAPDVVLTAGSCVSSVPLAMPCPPDAPYTRVPSPSSVHILVGDSVGMVSERASARSLLVASGASQCIGDIAFVLLDAPLDEITPLVVRPTGAARGDRLRTIDFGRAGTDPAPVERVRDHLQVLDTTDTQLGIGERCEPSQGGPALDESTAQIVGVAQPSPRGTCLGAAPSVPYARTDVLLMPIGQALAESYVGQESTRGRLKTKKGPIDMGANCAHGGDCAAGICVQEPNQAYCSRTCSTHDRCPAHFACQKSAGVLSVCVEH